MKVTSCNLKLCTDKKDLTAVSAFSLKEKKHQTSKSFRLCSIVLNQCQQGWVSMQHQGGHRPARDGQYWPAWRSQQPSGRCCWSVSGQMANESSGTGVVNCDGMEHDQWDPYGGCGRFTVSTVTLTLTRQMRGWLMKHRNHSSKETRNQSQHDLSSRYR